MSIRVRLHAVKVDLKVTALSSFSSVQLFPPSLLSVRVPCRRDPEACWRRLRVRFAVKRVGFDGRLQLFSLDRTGYHVLEDQSQLPPHLLQGLSNSLLLSDAVGTLAIMVCNYPLVRPTIAFCPFSVATYPQPCTPEWQQRCEMRTFVYELHVSNEMVLFPSLGSTLYWVCSFFWPSRCIERCRGLTQGFVVWQAYSKLLHRQYAAAFLAIQSCCTGTGRLPCHCLPRLF